MLKGEKKALYKFISLYVFSMILFFMAASMYYYESNTDRILKEKMSHFQKEKQRFMLRFSELNRHADTPIFPEDFDNVSILDKEGSIIFGISNLPKEAKKLGFFQNESGLYFISSFPPKFFQDALIVIKSEGIEEEKTLLKQEIALAVFIGMILTTLLSYFLSKLFLHPLQERIQMLDNFIKDSAHEMGTPISAITMSCEVLEDRELDEKTKKRVSIIKNSATALSIIYDDLLFAAFPEKFKTEHQEMNLKNLILEIIAIHRPMIEQKKILLVCELEDTILKTDGIRMKKIISNLLSNSIKYNKIGGKISISLAKELLTIEDTGCGIPQDKIEKIFDRYYRIESELGGFGIGLNLVQNLSNELGIKLELTSEVVKGTRISLQLPASRTIHT